MKSTTMQPPESRFYFVRMRRPGLVEGRTVKAGSVELVKPGTMFALVERGDAEPYDTRSRELVEASKREQADVRARLRNGCYSRQTTTRF
jgi:hypothetical protein